MLALKQLSDMPKKHLKGRGKGQICPIFGSIIQKHAHIAHHTLPTAPTAIVHPTGHLMNTRLEDVIKGKTRDSPSCDKRIVAPKAK